MFIQRINRLTSGSRKRARKNRRSLLLENLENRKLLAANTMLAVDDVPAESGIMDPTNHATLTIARNSQHLCNAHSSDPSKSSEHCAALALAIPENASHSVVASGDWSNPSVWHNRTFPSARADVYIPEGLTLTVDGVVAETLHTVRIDGILRFNTTVDTELRVDTIVGSTSSTFEMGTVENPIARNVTARILVADTGEIDRTWDPQALSRGVVLHGKSSINGAAKNNWSSLQTAPQSGDTSIVLTETPTGWRVGDSLVIAGTKADATGDEVVKVSLINGTTITLDRALQFDHLTPAADLKVHVANTTRNAVIESENTALDRRGHVMFMHSRDVQVANAGFYELGRSNKLQTVNDAQLDRNGALVEGSGTNVRGRYSVHFHRNGVKKDSAPARVTGSAVVGSPGWGYVNHSSYVDFIDNVSYDVDGAAFNTEVGDEVGSFVNNLSIKTHGTGGEPFEDGDNQDFGRAGDGFWFHGSGIAAQGNVAAGATGSGMIFWGETLVIGKDADGNPPDGGTIAEYLVENLPDPTLILNHTSIPTLYVPLHSVSNNQAYGARKGFEVYHHGDGELSANQNDRFGIEDGNLDVNPFNLPDSAIDGVTVWNSRTGIKLSYTENIRIRNVRLVNDFGQQGDIGLDAGTNLYNGGNHTYENLNIEGFSTGLLAPRGEMVVIDGGSFANQVDIDIPETRQTHRRMDIKGDIRFSALPANAPTRVAESRQNIVMEADLRNIIDGNVTWFLLSDRVTLNYGDFNGQQLYYSDQTADKVLFSQQPEDVDPEDSGFDVPQQFIGLTNAELQTTHMASFGGVLPPSDAVDAAGDGIVGLVGSATGDPMLPGKPGDIDVPVVGTANESGEEEENEEETDEDDEECDGDVVHEEETDEDETDEEEADEEETDEDETDEEVSDEDETDEEVTDEEETDEETGQSVPASFRHDVTFNGETVSVDFSKFSNRGPHFGVLEQQPDGSIVQRDAGPIRTYLGTVDGYPGAIAAGLLRADGSVLTRITFENGQEWIDDGSSVVASELDAFTPSYPETVVRNGGAGSELYAAQLGIDLPYDQVVASGGTTTRAQEIAEFSIMALNMLYLRDTAVINQIERVLVRLNPEADPYANSDELLNAVTSEWENVLPDGNDDIVLVASPRMDGTGVAYVASIGHPGFSANGSASNGDFSGVARHELGHNWSLGHYDGGAPEGPTINSGNDLARMSGPEVELVLQHRTDQAQFLDNPGTPTVSIPPRASDDALVIQAGSNEVAIRVLINDNDVNGTSLSILEFDQRTQNGRVVIQSGNQLIVNVPTGTDIGDDHFSYRIQDADGMTSTANVHLRVTAGGQEEVEGERIRFHNQNRPTDVNNDGTTSPLDALHIINHLNTHGAGLLQILSEPITYSLDVNGDGVASAIDALQIINILSQADASDGEGETSDTDNISFVPIGRHEQFVDDFFTHREDDDLQGWFDV